MQTIHLDISNKSVVPTVYAKQNDVGRKFAVILTDSGIPYTPTTGSVFSVWYKGASGEGNYTDIGDKTAFSLSGNKVEIEMIVQMLSNHGDGVLCLTLNSPDGDQISSWNIPYMCEIVPGSESDEANAYYTAFSEAVKNLPYTDPSLSIEGKSADALATGLALSGKAPAGYGLGKSSYNEPGTSFSSKQQLDAMNGNGFFAYRNMDVPLIDGDTSTIYGFGVQYQYSPSFAKQIFTAVYQPTTIERQKIDGVWGEWEYSKMNVLANREYRTTERLRSKVVYVKSVNFGALPNATTKTVNFATERTGDIRWSGYMKKSDGTGQGVAFPYNKGDGDFVDCCIADGKIYVTSGKDLSSWNGYITVYYTKD